MASKQEIIEEFAMYEDFESKAQAGRVFEHLKAIIAKALVEDGEVALGQDFGTLKLTERAARNGRNPQTGEPLKIAAKTTAVFKPSSPFKASLNK